MHFQTFFLYLIFLLKEEFINGVLRTNKDKNKIQFIIAKKNQEEVLLLYLLSTKLLLIKKLINIYTYLFIFQLLIYSVNK